MHAFSWKIYEHTQKKALYVYPIMAYGMTYSMT